jgi:hypothetical protein
VRSFQAHRLLTLSSFSAKLAVPQREAIDGEATKRIAMSSTDLGSVAYDALIAAAI